MDDKKTQAVIEQLERMVNCSLKEGKWREIPEELHGMDLRFVWAELHTQFGISVEVNEEGTHILAKIIKGD